MARQTQPTARPVQKVWLMGSESGSLVAGNTGTAAATSMLFTPIGGHTENSSLSSAVTLTPPAGANVLMFGVEDQPVRMRIDQVDATANVGFLFNDGDIVLFQFAAGTVFSFIETTATATIQYQWGAI